MSVRRILTIDNAADLAVLKQVSKPVEAVDADVRALMDDIEQLWSPRASQDGVTLMIGYEGDTELAAEIDPMRLKQVFNNLIGNALKFARNGMVEARLKAWAEGDLIHMEARVRDDGPGIDADKVDDIFEPFVHGSGPDGAGLGLAVVQAVVRAHRGELRLRSRVGRGTCATLVLPLITAAQPDTQE